MSSLRPPDLSYSAPSRLILVALVFKLLLLSSPQCMRLYNTLYTYYSSYYPKLKSFTNLSLQRLNPLLHPECSLSTGDTLGSQSLGESQNTPINPMQGFLGRLAVLHPELNEDTWGSALVSSGEGRSLEGPKADLGYTQLDVQQ